jgi:molybdopterin biosynthesis enzyme
MFVGCDLPIKALPIHPHTQTNEHSRKHMAELPYYIPVDDALDIVRANALPTQIEEVTLDNASGRILATELKSKVNDPPFDNSSMDGYTCFYDGQTTFESYRVIGLVQAAKDDQSIVAKQGEAVRIMTGELQRHYSHRTDRTN